MRRFFRWLLGLLRFGKLGGGRSSPSGSPSRAIVPLLIYPRVDNGLVLNEADQVGDESYYVSEPWLLDTDKVKQTIVFADQWLTQALGTRIPWVSLLTVHSHHSLADWRTKKISLIKEEVERHGLPWTEDRVYLAFVRGMGAYAGGYGYGDSTPGYAMVGDVCLEAICEFSNPNAGSTLLGANGWPANSYGAPGQTGAFTHEALHGLGLPHPDQWEEGNQPGWDETLMGNWWNMPNFQSTSGLTQREIDKVLEWLGQ